MYVSQNSEREVEGERLTAVVLVCHFPRPSSSAHFYERVRTRIVRIPSVHLKTA